MLECGNVGGFSGCDSTSVVLARPRDRGRPMARPARASPPPNKQHVAGSKEAGQAYPARKTHRRETRWALGPARSRTTSSRRCTPPPSARNNFHLLLVHGRRQSLPWRKPQCPSSERRAGLAKRGALPSGYLRFQCGDVSKAELQKMSLNLHLAGQVPWSCTSTLALTAVPAFPTPPSSEALIPTLPGCPQLARDVIYVPVEVNNLDAPGAGLGSARAPPPSSDGGTPGKVPSADTTDVSYAHEGVQRDMKDVKTKATIGVLTALISYMSLNSIHRAIDPEAFIWYDEDREESQWMATSKSWLDRKACRWLSICGAGHLRWGGHHFGRRVAQHGGQNKMDPADEWDWQQAWNEGKDRPEDWSTDERVLREIPEYVLEYAPLVHLFSGEQFWPGDIAEHLYHTTPTLNYTPMQPELQHPTLDDLDQLNDFEHGRHVFLTSNDDPEQRPEWLEGEKNIPNSPPDSGWQEGLGEHYPGRSYFDRDSDPDETEEIWSWASEAEDVDTEVLQIPGKHRGGHTRHHELRRHARSTSPEKQIRGGRSDAPAVLIVVNKGHGIVDAFWFFFYSFNLGNTVFNVRFGNHVGDWEHSAVRFHNGKPKAVFFSEHNFGSAYSYGAVEKLGKRPIIYSATGTHAMYATEGLHPYVLPWGILHDESDKGPLWDPVLNSHAYTYDYKNDTLRSSTLTPKAPTGWFYFAGHWGDKFYPLGDKRQYRFAGQYHYVNGPIGPRFKDLGRKQICAGPDEVPCVIKNWLGGSLSRIQRTQGPGEGEDLSPEDEVKFFGNRTDL